MHGFVSESLRYMVMPALCFLLMAALLSRTNRLSDLPVMPQWLTWLVMITCAYTFCPLVAVRLRGFQCIHRAELVVIIWIFAHFERAQIHTDSAFANDWIHKLKGHPEQVLDPLHDDFDLLRRVAAILRPGHGAVKIKAHQDCVSIPDLQRCYEALANQAADKLAVDTSRNLLPEAATLLWQVGSDYIQEAQDLKQFFEYLHQVNVARAQASIDEEEVDAQVTVATVSILDQLKQWAIPDGWRCPQEICEDWFCESCWGLQLMWHMRDFLFQCVWPSNLEQLDGHAALGFTWVELAVALAIRYGQWLPVKRARADGEICLYQPLSETEVAQSGTSLGEQAWTASQLWIHFLSLTPDEVVPCLRKGKVRSLETYGFNLKMSGVHARPAYPGQPDVITCLQNYVPKAIADSSISQQISCKLGGLPVLPNINTCNLWPEDEQLFAQPSGIQSKRACVAQRRVKQLRKRLDDDM